MAKQIKTKNSNDNFDIVPDKRGVIKTRSGLMTVDKVIQFMDAFYRNNGNATAAAMEVFNCSSRGIASEMGRKYLEKARKRGLVASFMENIDISYGDLIKHAYEKMKDSKNPAWWDRLMKEAGYAKQIDEEKIQKQTNVNINVGQAHTQLSESYIDAEIVDEDDSLEEVDD